MHPVLLHQLADDSVNERRRHQPHDHRRPRLVRRPSRIRLGLGGLLITAGTRLSRPRAGPSGLQHRPSTPA